MNNLNKNIEDEINFGNVVKNPVRWFGLVYPYMIIVILIIGIFWSDNLGLIATNKVPPAIYDSTMNAKPLPVIKGSFIQGAKLDELQQSNPELVENGRALFKTNCVSCHGDDGKGDGPAGAALNPKPRNFHSSEGWINGRKLSEMYRTLQEGIPGSGMSAYNYLPVKDRFSLIYFIRTLASDFPEFTSDELNDMNTQYNLTQDITVPSQIPVAKAMEIIANEASPEIINIQRLISLNEDNKNDAGAKILDKVLLNPNYLFSTLLKSEEWKSDLKDFAQTAAYEAPYNGFDPKVAYLPESDLKELHGYLVNLINKVSK